MQKIIVVSFASEKFYRAQQNLNQSLKGNGPTGYSNFNDHNLSDEFKKKNHKIYNQSRGFGYWCWKPFILLETLKLLVDGDIVVYLDACNQVIHPLNYIIDKCNDDGIVLFDNRDGNYQHECWINSEWTKRDCFTLMNCDEPKYWEGKQCNASYQLYKKCSKSIRFLEEYMGFCENENIITDMPNITSDNFPEFKDHRHDQSIVSLLAIKNDIELLPDPSEWGNWELSRPYPQLFWHCRGLL